MSARKVVALALFAAVAVAAARYVFWNPRRDVARRLAAIGVAASVDSGAAPLDRASKAAQLGGFVTDDVMIRTDPSSFVGGRPAVVRLAMDAAESHKDLRLTVDDLQVELIDPDTATAFFTLTVTDGEHSEPSARQVHATFVKPHGEWLLARGEVLRTLGAK
jgi:hypothetical protein